MSTSFHSFPSIAWKSKKGVRTLLAFFNQLYSFTAYKPYFIQNIKASRETGFYLDKTLSIKYLKNCIQNDITAQRLSLDDR